MSDATDDKRRSIEPTMPVRALVVVGAIASIFAFFFARNLVHDVFEGVNPIAYAAVFAGFALFGATFVATRYRDIPTLLGALTRATAIGVAFYLIIEPPSFTLVNPDASALFGLLNFMYWPSLALAALSIWRPSLTLLPAIYVLAVRDAAQHISGFQISTLDIRYMLEMAIFLGVAAALIGRINKKGPPAHLDEFAQCISFAAIGLHFANYFWSGMAKLALGPTPLSWMLENATPNLLLIALDRGVLPVGPIPQLTDALYNATSETFVIFNAFVLLTQLAAIIAVLRVFWLKLASLAYDVLHIGIWLLGGLFFWPWVWTNLSILFAVQKDRNFIIGTGPKIVCLVVILMGGAQELGRAAALAWWDVPDLKRGNFEVRTDVDGPWIRVPISFWMSHSYSVSHGYQDLVHSEGHFPPSIWGSVYDPERAATAGACPSPEAFSQADRFETLAAQQDRLDRVEGFVRAHHARMLESGASLGTIAGTPWFYWRSHHHPSVPWLHRDFNALDLHDISQYRLVTRSMCLSLENGALRRQILSEDEVIFDVR